MPVELEVSETEVEVVVVDASEEDVAWDTVLAGEDSGGVEEETEVLLDEEVLADELEEA